MGDQGPVETICQNYCGGGKREPLLSNNHDAQTVLEPHAGTCWKSDGEPARRLEEKLKIGNDDGMIRELGNNTE